MMMSTEKRRVRYVLNDIEGTTSEIAFVHQVLFPYAAQRLPSFIREFYHSPEVSEALGQVAEECALSIDQRERLIETLLDWIRADRKATPLKTLQGLIWRNGYHSGDFKGHLYLDAYHALREWADRGLKLGVYSSGSVEAQRLLFAHSEYGDLTGLFSDHFDTKVGHKRVSQSYQDISEKLIRLGRVTSAGEILFLSDVVEELDAAHLSGMQTCELRRDEASASDRHVSARDFSEVGRSFSLI